MAQHSSETAELVRQDFTAKTCRVPVLCLQRRSSQCVSSHFIPRTQEAEAQGQRVSESLRVVTPASISRQEFVSLSIRLFKDVH